VYDELDPVMNMAEVIVIDRSGSMYKNGLIDPAIRAAIIRAEVLGYFGVPTNIIFFDDSVTEAMGWDGAVG
jgi:cobalamin biosynthesis protein CobT